MALRAHERLGRKLKKHGAQARLARRLNVSRKHISCIVAGKSRPSLDLAKAIEDMTGIPAREF